MTQTIGFTKDEYGDYVATTGERIAKYRGAELYGRGSSGWYITEVGGEFFGSKHDTVQYIEIVIAESAAVLAKYAQTQKVGA